MCYSLQKIVGFLTHFQCLFYVLGIWIHRALIMRLNFVIQIPIVVKLPDFCSGAIGWILFPFLVLSGSPDFWPLGSLTSRWHKPMTRNIRWDYLNVHFISGELAKFGSLAANDRSQWQDLDDITACCYKAKEASLKTKSTI